MHANNTDIKDYRSGFTSGFGDTENILLRNVSMPDAPKVDNYILDNGVGEIRNIRLEGIVADGVELSPNSFLTTDTTHPN